MDSFELKTYPDSCLRIKTKPVEKFDREVEDVLRRISEMMYVNRGIGLAATQMGLGLSIVVVDVGAGLKYFINPVIVERSSKKNKMEEGCLSLPGVVVNVSRPESIKVRAQNEKGEFFMSKYDGLISKALQHEIDHLNGKLIIDYLDPVRSFLAKRRLARAKYSRDAETCEVICNAGKTNI